MRPIIGITGRPQFVPSVTLEIKAYLATHTYTDSVRHAGGIPMIMVPVEEDSIDDVLDRVDGVLMTGGGDMNPARYGAEPDPTLRGVNDERDAFELAVVERARARKIPVMGICRGLQVINVAHGGSLIQDLPSHAGVEGHDVVGEQVYEPHLHAEVDEGTRLAAAIGAGRHEINSIHHQAVQRLGSGLSISAVAVDGTIEAIETTDETWPMFAVQWHPEFLGMREHGPSHDLFAALVEAAAKYRADA